MNKECAELLFDCYNQFAYSTYADYQDWENHILTNGGLSTLEWLESYLGFESPITRGELWEFQSQYIASIEEEDKKIARRLYEEYDTDDGAWLHNAPGEKIAQILFPDWLDNK